MLAKNALTTLSSARTYCGLTDSSKDEQLELFINASSQMLTGECNRTFETATITEDIKPTANKLIYPKLTPILAIEKILVDGIAITDYTNSEHAIARQQGWAAKSILVTYHGGYILPKDSTTETPSTLPYDIELAVLATVKYFYLMDGSEHLISESVGPLKYQYLQNVPDVVTRIMAKYRRYPI